MKVINEEYPNKSWMKMRIQSITMAKRAYYKASLKSITGNEKSNLYVWYTQRWNEVHALLIPKIWVK